MLVAGDTRRGERGAKLSSMLKSPGRIAARFAFPIFCLAGASAQTPVVPAQAPPASPSGIVVAHPTYVSIPMEITVSRPAAEVWKRVGKYCDIGEWLQVA